MQTKRASTDINSHKIEDDLINYLLLIGSLFGLLSLFSATFVGSLRSHFFAVYGAMIAIGFGLFVLRKRISLKVKVNALIFFLMGCVCYGVVSDGPRSTATLLIILVALMALLIYEKRWAITVYLSSVAIFLGFGIVGRYFYSPLGNSAIPVWIAHAMVLIMIGLLIQLYISTYIKSLKELLLDANEHLEALNASQRELEKTKNLLENAIAHCPSGIMIADADSRKLSLANEAAFFIHGGSSEILKGIDPQAYTKHWEVLDTDGVPYEPTQLPLYRALVMGEYVRNEEAIIKVPQSQEKHWISANAAPIHDAEGNIISAIILFHDISEIKKAQINLEKLVAERTSRLEDSYQHLNIQKEQLEQSLEELRETQSQLIRSEKMASLGILVAGVGHEINNPLNFVQGGVLGIRKYIEENEARIAQLQEISPYVESIEEGVSRAARIVKSLTHISRQNPAKDERCNIHEIVENCLVILNNKLKHRITVVREYTDRELVVIGNEGKLHQVFMNVLSNAEQAIAKEGVVTIQTEAKNDKVVIKITDTGAGISEEHMANIGDPFFTTKEPGVGVGLGLYIVHTILEEQRGNWHVESNMGEGTKFTVTLQLHDEGDVTTPKG